MRISRTWSALWGAISLCLFNHVSAETQIEDPNLAMIKEFNVVLTDNTKVSDLFCCMSTNIELMTNAQYHCFAHLPLELGKAPGSRRIGIQFCSHLPGSEPKDATEAFKKACTDATGVLVTPTSGYCPQIWDNYSDSYHKPAPPPAPAPGGSPASPPPSTPDNTGKNTNDKDGFKWHGNMQYNLVDYEITTSLACCSGANAPFTAPHKYKCAQRKPHKSVFMRQCAQILPTITKSKKPSGYTTLDDGSDDVVDEATKQQCSAMWTNAVTYTYGFCRLDYDYAAMEAVKAFTDECTAKGGKYKEAHHGLCLWNVDDAADDSGSQDA